MDSKKEDPWECEGDFVDSKAADTLGSWGMKIGGFVGILAGVAVGFSEAGIGGAIVGAVIGLLGGIISGLIGGFVVGLMIFRVIPFLLLVGVVAGIGWLSYWVISSLWNVGKP